MKLVKYEFYKLFSKRLFIICFLLFLAFNTVVLYSTQSNGLETSVIHNHSKDYNEIINEISNLPASEVQLELKSKLKVVEIALQLDSLSENSDSRNLEYIESMLTDYQAESPEEYEQALMLDIPRQELLDRQTYLSELVSQSEYVNSYDSFIGEMYQRAEHQLKFSIFAKKGTFAYNNIAKTPTDFKELNGIQIKVGNNSVVENATTFVMTDSLVFALVFLMCIYIFNFERDKELYGLVRTNKNGRLPLIASKLFVTVFTTVLTCIVYYLSDIVVCGAYSGFGDMTRCIQSSSIFMNCSLNLQMWEYLVLWCLSKTVTMCVIAMVLAFIFVVIKNTATIIIATAALIAVQGVLYSAIESNSPANQFKYINFFYFLDENNTFGNYLNVNFFSHPINIISIYILLMPLLFTLLTALNCTSFVKQNQKSSGSVFVSLIEKIRAKFSKVKGSTSVFSGECFKHYKGSMAILVALFLILVAYTNLTDNISIVYASARESAYSSYMVELEGEYTAEKEEFLKEQQEYFDSLYEKLNEISMDTALSVEEKEVRISAINSIIESKGAAFNDVLQQASYIKDIGVQYDITPEFINKTVYKRLVEDPTREWQYFTLLTAIVIFIASNVFAYEHKKQMVNLIRCTRKGKIRLVISKISVALLTAIISFILIYLPYYINFVKTFGTASLDSPLIFMQDFSGINSTMSINEMIFLTVAVHIVFAVMSVMLVSMFSQVLKSNILSIIVASVVLLVPCLLCKDVPTIRLFTAFQNGMWQWFVPLLFILLSFISLLCFAATSISFCRFTITSVRRKINV